MSVGSGIGRRLIMNIVVGLVMIVSTGFLLRFLMALTKEQNKTSKLLRAHWLHYAIVAKNNPAERMSLRIVPPQEFIVRHVLPISKTKIKQQQKLG